MEQEVTLERTKLLKGHRWPKDCYGDEIDVGDFLMCVIWNGYPTASVGRVTKIGRTGKVTVETVKTHPRDKVCEQEIKEIRYATKLSQNVMKAFLFDKLSVG
jgi:hypothetical protein